MLTPSDVVWNSFAAAEALTLHGKCFGPQSGYAGEVRTQTSMTLNPNSPHLCFLDLRLKPTLDSAAPTPMRKSFIPSLVI